MKKNILFSIFWAMATLAFAQTPKQYSLTGMVYERSTFQPLTHTTVELYEGDKLVGSAAIDYPEKAFSFTVEAFKAYKVVAKKSGYIDEAVQIYIDPEEVRQSLLVRLHLGKTEDFFEFKGIVLDRETRQPIPNVKVELRNTMTTEKMSTVTNEGGIYSFTIKSGYDYSVLAFNRNYLKRRGQISLGAGVRDKKYLYCVSGFYSFDGKESEVLMDKIEVGKTFKVENIFYDLDKYNIRPDAAKELDRLVAILKDNPSDRNRVRLALR